MLSDSDDAPIDHVSFKKKIVKSESAVEEECLNCIQIGFDASAILNAAKGHSFWKTHKEHRKKIFCRTFHIPPNVLAHFQL